MRPQVPLDVCYKKLTAIVEAELNKELDLLDRTIAKSKDQRL